MCLNKQDYMPRVSQCRNSEYGKVLNKARFSKYECYTAY